MFAVTTALGPVSTAWMSHMVPTRICHDLLDYAHEAAELLVQHVVVMDGDELVGVVSRHDMAKVFLWKQQA